MDRERPADPPSSGDAVTPLQPEDWPDLDYPELEQALNAAEFRTANERLQRLDGDQDLLLHLQLAKFSGIDWETASGEFVVYGWVVLRSWVRTRKIYLKVKHRTRFGLPEAPAGWLDDDDTVDGLVNETLRRAITRFRTVLMGNQWRPDGGASLRTYFIGQCLFQFRDVYRTECARERRRRRQESIGLPDGVDGWVCGSAQAADSSVVRVASAEQVLRTIAPRPREAIVRQLRGESLDEIADALGLSSAEQVKNLLHYERQKLRNRRDDVLREIS
jgi:DNA-directed RNA polymerase specialized sigma24 family protein